MRLGTVQETGYIGERQKTKVIEAIHEFFCRAGRGRRSAQTLHSPDIQARYADRGKKIRLLAPELIVPIFEAQRLLVLKS